MEDLVSKLGIYFWVVVVGLLGGALGSINNKEQTINRERKVINFIVDTISSSFICWIFFEIASFFTNNNDRFSLAVGGFFSWRGTAWIRAVVDKVIDKKISSFGSYDDFPPKPPKDLNF
jgi:hypothetical protein